MTSTISERRESHHIATNHRSGPIPQATQSATAVHWVLDSPFGSGYPPFYHMTSAQYASGSLKPADYTVVPTNGKATAVEELKALILAAEPGTGQIAKHIKEAQFTPRHNAFTSLLQLASKSRQPDKAIEIFDAMQTVAGISPNTFSYSALISALARVGNWQQAEQYFNELKQKAATDPAMKPNTVTYAALISAYEKGRQLDKALATFQEQLDVGIEPDVITYASLLSACERSGSVDRAVDLLDQMHAQGLAGPPQMYNSVIASCGVRWKPALEAFLGMQCAGVEANAQSATLLMASLCAGRQRDHAMALLQQVSKARWTLSLTAYTSLLELLSSLGDWRAGDVVHAHMVGVGARVDEGAATAIVNSHAIGGDQVGAEQLSSYFHACGIIRGGGGGRGGGPAYYQQHPHQQQHYQYYGGTRSGPPSAISSQSGGGRGGLSGGGTSGGGVSGQTVSERESEGHLSLPISESLDSEPY